MTEMERPHFDQPSSSADAELTELFADFLPAYQRFAVLPPNPEAVDTEGARLAAEAEALRPLKRLDYIEAVRQYGEQKRHGALHGYQKDIFADFADFLERGEVEGFLDEPTGSGKTVEFIEICRALLSGTPHLAPKILVVTPRRGLVRQTEGRQKRNQTEDEIAKGGQPEMTGFAHFAPEIEVGTYYGDTKQEDKTLEQQVVITTYNSLKILGERNEKTELSPGEYASEVASTVARLKGGKSFEAKLPAEGISPEIFVSRKNTTGYSLLDKFDVVIFDEGHRASSEVVEEIRAMLAPDVLQIAVTATPEYDADRNLDNSFKTLIHRTDALEAIQMGILSPFVAFGIHSEADLSDKRMLRSDGTDYHQERIAFLGEEARRNELIVEATKALVEAGIPPIVSCLAGKGMLHPYLIAEMFNRTTIIDPITGEERLGVCVAVTSKTTAAAREQISRDYEDGIIDALTFIDVLGEGWDSQRAAGIVNGRPTRSKVLGKQRPGRVLRWANGKIAVAVDIIDKHTQEIPPVTAADAINGENMDITTPIGTLDAEAQRKLTVLKERIAPLSPQPLEAEFARNESHYMKLLALGKSARIKVLSEQGFVTAGQLEGKDHGMRGATDLFLDRLIKHGYELQRLEAVSGRSTKFVYHELDIPQIMEALPIVSHAHFYRDEQSQRWATAKGYYAAIKHLLKDSVTPEAVEDCLDRMVDQEVLGWKPAKIEEIPAGSQHVAIHFVASLYPVAGAKEVVRQLAVNRDL